MDLQHIQSLAAEGESETLELKASTSEQHDGLKALCGMVNARGGTLLFGVTPDGKVLGQHVGEQTVHKLAQEINQKFEPSISPRIETVAVDEGREVIVVSVPQGRLRPYAYGGITYAKVGNTKTRMAQDERDRLTAERLHASDSWDATPASVEIAELDLDELEATVREAVSRQRMGDLPDYAPATMLRALGLLTRAGELRNAAAILFGEQSMLAGEYPQCALTLVRYRGSTKTGTTLDSRRYDGNAFSLLRHAETFLADHLHVASQLRGMERTDVPEIPVLSQREAIVNALCHRQYETPGATSIYVYDDRVEIASIGPLHFGLKAADLLAPHESLPWNPLVTIGMYRRGLVDSQGSGTLRMLERARTDGKWRPDIIATPHSVRVEFVRDGCVPSRYAALSLSETRLSILRLIGANHEPVAPAAIVAALGTHKVTVSGHLRFLTDEGLIVPSGTARARRYTLA